MEVRYNSVTATLSEDELSLLVTGKHSESLRLLGTSFPMFVKRDTPVNSISVTLPENHEFGIVVLVAGSTTYVIKVNQSGGGDGTKLHIDLSDEYCPPIDRPIQIYPSKVSSDLSRIETMVNDIIIATYPDSDNPERRLKHASCDDICSYIAGQIDGEELLQRCSNFPAVEYDDAPEGS